MQISRKWSRCGHLDFAFMVRGVYVLRVSFCYCGGLFLLALLKGRLGCFLLLNVLSSSKLIFIAGFVEACFAASKNWTFCLVCVWRGIVVLRGSLVCCVNGWRDTNVLGCIIMDLPNLSNMSLTYDTGGLQLLYCCLLGCSFLRTL